MFSENPIISFIVITFLLCFPLCQMSRLRFLWYAGYLAAFPFFGIVAWSYETGLPVWEYPNWHYFFTKGILNISGYLYVAAALITIIVLYPAYWRKGTFQCNKCEHIATKRGTVCPKCKGEMSTYLGQYAQATVIPTSSDTADHSKQEQEQTLTPPEQ